MNRSLQYRFLALILVYGFIFLMFFGITLFLPEIREMHDESLSMAVRGAAAERILSKHIWVWPAVIFLVCLMAAHSFLMVHRVAGPLYRFRRTFEQIRDGNLGFRVRIREKDYLHPEEDSLNEMLESLSNRVLAAQEFSNTALRSFERIERSLVDTSEGNDLDRKLQSYIKTHGHSLRALSDALKFFKLERG
ncbi:MAG: methyl-accepting chemotaxis protein [Deltaproteobacteria bacterium]|nr:methyl-accepting chemotaxis protein [Deltaproteobacteria bacterium]MBW2136008.1 methyl-accepting chemotaxis protein [Deltaproteobacteria bacterium]